MTELSGYNFKRQEFEIEYDNDAEQILADMEFKDTDTNADRELKLRVLHVYANRLDERKRRKNFVLERNLLYPDPLRRALHLKKEKYTSVSKFSCGSTQVKSTRNCLRISLRNNRWSKEYWIFRKLELLAVG